MLGKVSRYFPLACTATILIAVEMLAFNGGVTRKATCKQQERNTKPVVKIQEPKNGAVYPPNVLVNYAINVSDKEDGESRYDEIPSNRIFLEVMFLKDPFKAKEVFKSTQFKSQGLALMMRSDCFNCHQFKSRLIGPSFSQIAMKYNGEDDAAKVAAHVIKGSTGIWGEEIMPAHPDLSEEDSMQIAEWILASGGIAGLDYLRGKTGSFRTVLPNGVESGLLILKAIYIDKGVEQNRDVLAGYDSLVIRCH